MLRKDDCEGRGRQAQRSVIFYFRGCFFFNMLFYKSFFFLHVLFFT